MPGTLDDLQPAAWNAVPELLGFALEDEPVIPALPPAADLVLAELCDLLTDLCVSRSLRSGDNDFGWAGSSAPEHTLDKREVGRFESSPAHHRMPLSRPPVLEVGAEIEMQCCVPVQAATCSRVVAAHSRIFPT